MKYGSRRRVQPKIRHLAPLDGCTCAFEEWVYWGQKVPLSHDMAHLVLMAPENKAWQWSDGYNWFLLWHWYRDLLLVKWARAWQNQQNALCTQRRRRSAWASAQSDQSSLGALLVSKDPNILQADSEDWLDWAMPRLIWVFAGCTGHFVVFCTLWLKWNTVNFLNIRTPKKICCKHSKIWTTWLYHRVMSPNDSDGMANSVDPDQTAPRGAVWSGSALFAQIYLSENIGSLR